MATGGVDVATIDRRKRTTGLGSRRRGVTVQNGAGLGLGLGLGSAGQLANLGLKIFESPFCNTVPSYLHRIGVRKNDLFLGLVSHRAWPDKPEPSPRARAMRFFGS